MGFSGLVQRSRMNFPSAPMKGTLLPKGPSDAGCEEHEWTDSREGVIQGSMFTAHHIGTLRDSRRKKIVVLVLLEKKKRKTKILRWLPDMCLLYRTLF